MKIVFATYLDKGKYSEEGFTEDKNLHKYLAAKGITTSFEIWDNPEVNWASYDLVLLKSPWDYFDKIEIFYAWLDKLDNLGVRVLNPTHIVRWNADKRYLMDIEKAGFAIVPTKILSQNEPANLTSYFESFATENIIVKPTVSGGAKHTYSLTKSEAEAFSPAFEALLQEESYLVQPFADEIKSQGEWSLLFFNGKFSHSILKVPQSGEFRVQHFFGGTIHEAIPPTYILEYGQKLINEFAKGCLYARVDGIESKGAFKLMELELIEPFYFLLEDEKRFENYYRGLMELINI